MALHSSQPQSTIERTQTLPHLPLLDSDESAQVAEPQPSCDEHETQYFAFEPPLEEPRSSEPVSDTQRAAEVDSVSPPPPGATKDVSELVQTQALELAANRAELARQERAQEDLQRTLKLRESWLQELRSELKAAQEDRGLMASQLAEARSKLEEMAGRIVQQQAQIASLETAVAERMERTTFDTSASRTSARKTAEALDLDRPATLEPLDDGGEPIILNRKMMTVGRTRDNDVYVPSAQVSRDHARMLVNEDSVVMFDVGSSNGCFVNDRQVKRQTLRDGDVLRFGDRRYVFHV